MFTESVFSKSHKKGKRRSSGIEGFRNTIHSLLNGNGGNSLLCNGLILVCELHLLLSPNKTVSVLNEIPLHPPIFKVLKSEQFVFNYITTLGDFCVFF